LPDAKQAINASARKQSNRPGRESISVLQGGGRVFLFLHSAEPFFREILLFLVTACLSLKQRKSKITY